jgi:YbbR domain-containing protein
MRDLLTKDFGWKLFSLALATAIWLTVQTIRNEAGPSANPLTAWETHTFDKLPVLVVSAAADVREFKVNPNIVQVTVGGRPDVIAALTEREIHAAVDLTEIEAAQDLRKRIDVSAPPGVTVVKIVPPLADVTMPPKPNKNK